MPLWDTANTCTPVPTLPCTRTDTHSQSEDYKLTPLHTCKLSTLEVCPPHTLTEAGKSLEKYISQVSLAAVTMVFFTCSSTGSMFCSTPCLAAVHKYRQTNIRGVFNKAYSWERETSTGKTDRLPKRAFIFCLSSRVMRTHASDRVSFTICKRKKENFCWIRLWSFLLSVKLIEHQKRGVKKIRATCLKMRSRTRGLLKLSLG